jgi:glutamate-1-semialdehyde 2,1-aminomutase
MSAQPLTLSPTARQLSDEYRAKTPKSGELHQRLAKSLASGETREIAFYRPYAMAIASAAGPRVTDYDNNTYIDLVNNLASLVHGHRFPPVWRAVEDAFHELGSAQAGPHRYLLQFAELLVERYPAFERVRLTNSASEAAILALRIARHATGRRRMLMFEGGYHGMGSEFTDPQPEVTRIPFNDEAAVSDAVDETVAAVFVESFLGSAGVIPAEPGFLEKIQECARRAGAVFVLDETQSLRGHYAAHHGAHRLRPDLVMMGKCVGGGLPIGVLGGKSELIEIASASHDGGLRHSGTFNGNVLSSAAGHQSMLALDAKAIANLNEKAAWLADELEAEGRRLRLPMVVTRANSTLCVHFMERAPANASEALPHTELAKWFHIAALLEGICVIRGGRLNLTTVLTDEDLASISRSLSGAFERLARLHQEEESRS